MDSRSIDFAKSASIDLMGLNNKIVNMRQVVKRTKVQVINKLCRVITALKKKKGTEEQKAKNLSKAERYLEEIDSIKKLKDDKVTKYSLANTRTFSDICKESQSAGPRALGRLADHPLMKKVVSDFREQHTDWQDLAAYLLIKQTGRRFKTKKQKQKKLSKCVENMNASETMTKAYIQERFGKEGLVKAQMKFESKKKKSEKASLTSETTDNKNAESKLISDSTISSASALVSNSDTSETVLQQSKNKTDVDNSLETNISALDYKPKTNSEECLLDRNIRMLENNSKDKENNASDKITIKHSSNVRNNVNIVETDFKKVSFDNDFNGSDDSNDSDSVPEKNLTDKLVKKSVLKAEVLKQDDNKIDSLQRKKECVVKELNLNDEECSDADIMIEESDPNSDNDLNSDNDSDSDNDESSSSVSEVDDEDGTDEDDSSSIASENANTQSKKTELEFNHSSKSRKDYKKKNKLKIPDFLMAAHSKPVNDPFFGSDDDDNNMLVIQEDNELLNDNDIGNDDLSFKRDRIGSMFYNPENKHSENVKKSFRYRQVQGRFSRRGSINKYGNDRKLGTHSNSHFKSKGGKKHNFKEHSFKEKHMDKSRKIGDFSTNKTSLNRVSSKPIDMKKASVKNEKLHPSWEASRKRKAEQSGIAEFKGKKITFDDD